MTDLIDRLWLMERLGIKEDCSECQYCQGSFYCSQGSEFVKACEAISDAPSVQPEPRWIPCSERLPEERGFYLTTTKDKVVYCDHWNEDNFDRTEMVIAWMPLPEPYEWSEG